MADRRSNAQTSPGDSARHWLIQAVEHQNAGRLDEAEKLYHQVLAKEPNNIDGCTNFAILMYGRLEFDQALALGERALVQRSDHAPAHNIRAMCLAAVGRLADADVAYAAAIAADPDMAEPYSNRANLLRRLGRPAAAADVATLAIQRRPDFAEAHNQLGNARFDLGDMAGAAEGYRAAIQHNPHHIMARHNLTMSKNYETGDPDIDQLRQWAGKLKNDDAQSWIRFALAKALDDVGSYEEAFLEANTANEIMKARGRFNLRGHQQLLDLVKQSPQTGAVADQELFVDHQAVFLLGASRSGKGVVQRLLGGLENIAVLDEGAPWRQVVLGAQQLDTSISDATLARSIYSADDLANLARAYRVAIAIRDPSATSSINASPGNLIYVGGIAATLPNAKFIHVRRDYRDLCLRIYFKRYVAGNEYAYHLPDIFEFIRQYDAMMSHWSAILGDRMIEVRYEDLVSEPSKVRARLAEYIGVADFALPHLQELSLREVGAWQHYVDQFSSVEGFDLEASL